MAASLRMSSRSSNLKIQKTCARETSRTGKTCPTTAQRDDHRSQERMTTQMADFTIEDVQRGADVIYGVRYGGSMTAAENLVDAILAAVMPAHDKRVRAEALREAANAVTEKTWLAYPWDEHVRRWLRARANAEEGK